MSDPVLDHLQLLAAERPVSLILHIGAGACRELPAYLASGAARIHLLEPNPVVAKALLGRTQAHPSITVETQAVAGRDGFGRLNVFNFAPLSSLHQPAGLRQLLPGLRQVGTPEVETVSVATLMSRLVPGMGPNLLVIDAPGEEGHILTDLRAGGFLHRFAHIMLYCGRIVLYEDSASWDDLHPMLQAEGYRLEGCTEDDPDRPCMILRLDPLALEVTGLQAALASAQAEAEAQASARAALAAELQQLTAQAEARQSRIAALETQLTGQVAALAARDEQLAGLNKGMELSRQVAQQARDDLAVGLRLQAMVQADLRDLQAQYGEVLAIKQRQEALLRKLTPKLQEAAQYLQGMGNLPVTTQTKIAVSGKPARISKKAARKAKKAKARNA